jgi:hypothetical protein
MVSPVVKPLTTGSVLKILFLSPGSVFVLTMPESILLSSTKQSIQVFKHLRVDSV